MIRRVSVLFVGAVLSCSAIASGGEVVLAEGQAKRSGGKDVSIDLVGASSASAFSFVINLPSDAANVDVSRCVSELPKSHVARCEKVSDTRVAVIGWSAKLEPLGSDLVAVGRISFDSMQKDAASVSDAKLSNP